MRDGNILEPPIPFQRVKTPERSDSHYASPLNFGILHATMSFDRAVYGEGKGLEKTNNRI
jgi:hypothetical protein